MPTIVVVPAEGLKVRDHKTGEHLPPKGAEVQDGPYWRRRLKDGDVTLGGNAETKVAPVKTKKSKE